MSPNAKLSEEEFVKSRYPDADINKGFMTAVFNGSKMLSTFHVNPLDAWADAASKLRAEEGIGEARCPSCKTGRNSRSLGGNERCFHCDSCGFVNCIENCPDPTLNQSPEGKPTESAQPDAPKDVVACPSCGAPIFVRPNGGIVAHYATGGNKCIANETLYVSQGNETKEVQELLNSMKVIDRYQWRQECRSDVLTSLMYELAAFRAAKAAPSTPVSAPQDAALEFIAKMRNYFHAFVNDAVRPDEWIMQEWVRKCDAIIGAKSVGQEETKK